MIMGFLAAPLVIAGIAFLLWLATSIESLVGAPPMVEDLPVVAIVTHDIAQAATAPALAQPATPTAAA